jgi:hypothetical protein
LFGSVWRLVQPEPHSSGVSPLQWTSEVPEALLLIDWEFSSFESRVSRLLSRLLPVAALMVAG